MGQDRRIVDSAIVEAKVDATTEALQVKVMDIPKSSDMNYGNVAIGGSAAQIVAANANREAVLVFNEDDSLILYVAKDNSVTTANGIPVHPKCFVAYDLYTGAVFGIASGAGCDVRYAELV